MTSRGYSRASGDRLATSQDRAAISPDRAPASVHADEDNPDLLHAAVLGALQGPAELLPISSSAHIAIVPRLLDWPYAEQRPATRKAFEVAAHAGTACAFLVLERARIVPFLKRLNSREAAVITLSCLPAAIVGYRWEKPIERRLGTPHTIALALVAGSVAMVLADRSPESRDHHEAGMVDGMYLGLAQAAALVPGVSRNGATLAAARWRGFTREESYLLSKKVALPIITGAALLKAIRLRHAATSRSTGLHLVTGFSAAFVSTLISAKLSRRLQRNHSLMPYAVYRCALAAMVASVTRHRSTKYAKGFSNSVSSGAPAGGY